jgi:dihydrofolate reductase
MRKLFSFNMVTLDGFFEGPTPWDIAWHNTDAEFGDFATQQLQTIDTILFGRRTYQGMASYWPSSEALESDPEIANAMNSISKIVVSTTLPSADWSNSHLIKDHVAEEIAKLKQQPGKDLAVFGSADLLSSLIRMNLVDEHRVMLNPVVLGKGTPLFKSVEEPLKLKLTGSRTFNNGNVLLTYEPEGLSS